FPATVKLHVRSPKTGLPIRNIMGMDKPIPERITSAVLRNAGRRSGSCAKQDYPYAPLQSKSDAQWTPYTMRLIATHDLSLLNVTVSFAWQRGKHGRVNRHLFHRGPQREIQRLPARPQALHAQRGRQR